MVTATPVQPTVLQLQLTEEQQSGTQLRHREQTFRRIFDQMSQLMWLLSPEGILLEVNQAALNFGGLQSADVKGCPFWQTPWWSLLTQTVEQLHYAIAAAGTGCSIRYRMDILGFGNTIATTDFSLKPIVDEAGCIVQLLAIGHEITNHKQTEATPRNSETNNCQMLEKNQALKLLLELQSREIVSANLANLIEFEGEPALLGTAVDVTKRKRVEAAIFQTLAQEKELSPWQLHFVSMLAHEIRRPLNIISLAASGMQNYGHQWSDPKKSKYMHRILDAVNQMDELLKKVLVIGRTDAGKLKCEPHPLDLVQFCQKLVSQIQFEAGNQHPIAFVFQDINQDKGSLPAATFPNSNPPKHFSLDEKLLECILANLLSNASKYSPPGSPVSLEVTLDNEQVIFRIEDQGIGIPLADRQKLFEPFHRARNVADIPGTGLGLAVVKRCVDLHGGQITCESEVGIGTTFTVKLPINGSQERASALEGETLSAV